ncbi:MAG TPA: hypothetical protein DCQ31_09600 [Bacteroidales bacterium]|nr:hypothetical protein [Bacteroidales bacterium]
MNKKLRFLICIVALSIASSAAYSCTTFVISGKYTTDGKPLLFKNRDTDQMQNSLHYFTDGKFKYIALVDGNTEWNSMVWGGYNEAGFAIINSAAYNNNVGDTTKFTDQEGVIMKLALQTCATLEDFENLLNSLPKPMGLDANFGVIDANGGAAYYETGNIDFKKYDANDPAIAPNGIIVRTNHSMRADLTQGFGYCRFNTATETLSKAAAKKLITPQFLYNNISRNLYHSLTKTNLFDNLPKDRNVPEYRFFIDYIPRESTASAIIIVGAPNKANANNAMMWTILGFPLTSVAVPVWIAGGNKLPKSVCLDANLNSPLCTAALKLKTACFPLTYDKGWNYINLSAVVNKQKTGIMQILQPIENEIFAKANSLINQIENKENKSSDIQQFYTWVDQYLGSSFKTKFGIEL